MLLKKLNIPHSYPTNPYKKCSILQIDPHGQFILMYISIKNSIYVIDRQKMISTVYDSLLNFAQTHQYSKKCQNPLEIQFQLKNKDLFYFFSGRMMNQVNKITISKKIKINNLKKNNGNINLECQQKVAITNQQLIKIFNVKRNDNQMKSNHKGTIKQGRFSLIQQDQVYLSHKNGPIISMQFINYSLYINFYNRKLIILQKDSKDNKWKQLREQNQQIKMPQQFIRLSVYYPQKEVKFYQRYSQILCLSQKIYKIDIQKLKKQYQNQCKNFKKQGLQFMSFQRYLQKLHYEDGKTIVPDKKILIEMIGVLKQPQFPVIIYQRRDNVLIMSCVEPQLRKNEQIINSKKQQIVKNQSNFNNKKNINKKKDSKITQSKSLPKPETITGQDFDLTLTHYQLDKKYQIPQQFSGMSQKQFYDNYLGDFNLFQIYQLSDCGKYIICKQIQDIAVDSSFQNSIIQEQSNKYFQLDALQQSIDLNQQTVIQITNNNKNKNNSKKILKQQQLSFLSQNTNIKRIQKIQFEYYSILSYRTGWQKVTRFDIKPIINPFYYKIQKYIIYSLLTQLIEQQSEKYHAQKKQKNKNQESKKYNKTKSHKKIKNKKQEQQKQYQQAYKQYMRTKKLQIIQLLQNFQSRYDIFLSLQIQDGIQYEVQQDQQQENQNSKQNKISFNKQNLNNYKNKCLKKNKNNVNLLNTELKRPCKYIVMILTIIDMKNNRKLTIKKYQNQKQEKKMKDKEEKEWRRSQMIEKQKQKQKQKRKVSNNKRQLDDFKQSQKIKNKKQQKNKNLQFKKIPNKQYVINPNPHPTNQPNNINILNPIQLRLIKIQKKKQSTHIQKQPMLKQFENYNHINKQYKQDQYAYHSEKYPLITIKNIQFQIQKIQFLTQTSFLIQSDQEDIYYFEFIDGQLKNIIAKLYAQLVVEMMEERGMWRKDEYDGRESEDETNEEDGSQKSQQNSEERNKQISQQQSSNQKSLQKIGLTYKKGQQRSKYHSQTSQFEQQQQSLNQSLSFHINHYNKNKNKNNKKNLKK